MKHDSPPTTAPGRSVVRVTVDSVDHAVGVARPGDRFEVRGALMSLPREGRFCPDLFAAVVPLIALRQSPLAPAHWLVRKPWISGPDPIENAVMHLDIVPEELP